MIESINRKITKEIVNIGISKRLVPRLSKRAVMLMMALSDISDLENLKKFCEPPSLKLHKLKGGLKDFWSITIEKPWCIIFRYFEGKFYDVEIGDYHD